MTLAANCFQNVIQLTASVEQHCHANNIAMPNVILLMMLKVSNESTVQHELKQRIQVLVGS